MRVKGLKGWLSGAAALALLAAGSTWAGTAPAQAATTAANTQTTTPIKHVVVIFGENVSFDHYFGTYPNAANTKGEKLQGGDAAATFTKAADTPTNINTLSAKGLLKSNPNTVAPFRLSPDQAVTCDQNHNYGKEQQAFDAGKMDKFVESVSTDKCASAGSNMYEHNGLTMGYYDGNTVAAEWNYAQHYAMSDNSYSSTFGPSTPGALNLISGNTHGARSYDPTTGKQTTDPDSYAIRTPDSNGVGTVINDPDPVYDDCSNSSGTSSNNLAGMDGKNVGDLLNDKSVSWGWFQGGFAPSSAATSSAKAKCLTAHDNVAGQSEVDYSPHHSPFQYYKSTSNPHHTAPANTAEIGHNGQANHNYDLTDFDKVVNSDNMPSVSYLKAAEYQDGHAAYSDPVDEQHFITKYINKIQQSQNWKDTAIVLAYDDSDGWYDHQAAVITNASNDTAASGDEKICTSAADKGVDIAGGYADRCGPGTRQPLLVISPYAKQNYVDHTQTDQASILKFIENNWSTGTVGDSSFDAKAGSLNGMFDFKAAPRTKPLILDEKNGAVVDDATPTTSAPATSAPATSAPATSAPSATQSASASPTASESAAAPADPATPTDGAKPGALPFTGANVGVPIAIGAALLIVGAIIWIATVRRRTRQ